MKRKILWIILGSFGLVLLAAGIFSFAYLQGTKASNNKLNNFTVLEIKEGESINEIGQKLHSKKVITNKLYFWLTYKLFNKTIRSGIYQFAPKASLVDVVAQLENGSNQVFRITIPEGWREEQIAQRLEANKITPYTAFLEESEAYRGRLFPDTYFFSIGMEARAVVLEMLENFNNRTKDLVVSEEQLILASIVEREAVKDEERALIAGVYQNRIDLGMKLEADPTTQYAKDNADSDNLSLERVVEFDYWGRITINDYQKYNSPYNTYVYEDLPPTPICNPGLKSIQAAINPEKHDYYYFLHRDGQIYPSKTIEEHNQKRASVLGARFNN